MASSSEPGSQSGPSQGIAPATTAPEENGSDRREPAEQARPRPWTVDSPFYDPQTMSATAIDRCQQYLRWERGPLFHLWRADRDRGATQLDLASETSRAAFTGDFDRRAADVDIFVLNQRYEHLSTSTNPREGGVMRFAIGLEEPTAIWLFEKLRIHPLFIEYLNYNIGHFAVFNTLHETTSETVATHFLIKIPPAGHLEAAYYLRYDHSSHRSTVIVTGNDLNGHAEMLQEHLMTVHPPYDPFALLLVVILRNYRFLEAQRRECDHAVVMTERETGRGAVAYSQGDATPGVSPDKFDLTFMHWLEGNQRNILFASQFQARLTAFLLDEHLHFLSLREAGAITWRSLGRRDRLIHERLRSHKVAAEGLHDACRIIRERIQRQLNAADSIINQYDNKVSIRNAEISTKIADQSRLIAVETRRDSTSMKTIAGLTMIYLPSTFAASIFSTGFFTYDTTQSAVIKINPQIWKLFVVAFALSIATTGIWVWLNKRGLPRLFNWVRHSPQEDGNDERDAGRKTTAGNDTDAEEKGEQEVVRRRPRINLPTNVAEDAV